MNGYKAFYKDKTIEIFANSSYEAQKKASLIFKAKKSYEITVILCESNNSQVVHSTSII